LKAATSNGFCADEQAAVLTDWATGQINTQLSVALKNGRGSGHSFFFVGSLCVFVPLWFIFLSFFSFVLRLRG
jgi:hypothetical protein